MNSWDVWTPGPKLSYMDYLRFKLKVVLFKWYEVIHLI